MIRNVTTADAPQICDIYNHYVKNTVVTFEESIVTSEEMHSRIDKAIEDANPWLVYENNDAVVGYAFTSRWKSRCSYRYSVESTIYLSGTSTGQGIGTRLYSELLSRIREMDMHSVIGGIALPNPASIALHEKLGFEKVGHFKEVGHKFDRWIDVGYWELVFEK